MTAAQKTMHTYCEVMTEQEHRERHIFLHHCLDELLADMIAHTNLLPSRATILELMQWSKAQTMRPEALNGQH